MKFSELQKESQQADKDNSDNQRKLALFGFGAVWLFVSGYVIFRAGVPLKPGDLVPAAPSNWVYGAGFLFAGALAADAAHLLLCAEHLRRWYVRDAAAPKGDTDEVSDTKKVGAAFVAGAYWLRFLLLLGGYLVLAGYVLFGVILA